ncbi:cyclin-A2-like [Gracilinanus agilis]|uniref:cyclin-A2-like n=1 Tax=Gracilinanus agilis TaxID=191870 RepID=UPI001CFE4426|nr:cyclin-A2-like [Gracilinanus agilis]
MAVSNGTYAKASPTDIVNHIASCCCLESLSSHSFLSWVKTWTFLRQFNVDTVEVTGMIFKSQVEPLEPQKLSETSGQSELHICLSPRLSKDMYPRVLGLHWVLPRVHQTQTAAQSGSGAGCLSETQGVTQEELRQREASSQENQETIHPDKFSNAKRSWKPTVLGRIQNKMRARATATTPKKPKRLLLAALGLNGKQRKATSQQPAFTVQRDEPDVESEKELLSPKKVQYEDNILDSNSAVSPPETRKPLVPCHQTKDDSSEASLPRDTSMKLEAQEMVSNIIEVSDYAEDIYLYLREMEVKRKLNVDFMKNQPDGTDRIRVFLVSWLVSLAEFHQLQDETLHLAVNYIDRYLSLESVSLGELSLIGIAALLVASKFEEVFPLRVGGLVNLLAGQFSKKEIIRMERRLLEVLTFDLSAPTINHFLTQYFLHQEQPNSEVENLAMFLGELSLINTDTYLKYLPSVIAGAAFHLALYTITGKSWPESLVRKTGYTLQSLKPCLLDLHQTYLRAPEQDLQIIQQKYEMAVHCSVSLIKPPETLKLE